MAFAGGCGRARRRGRDRARNRRRDPPPRPPCAPNWRRRCSAICSARPTAPRRRWPKDRCAIATWWACWPRAARPSRRSRTMICPTGGRPPSEDGPGATAPPRPGRVDVPLLHRPDLHRARRGPAARGSPAAGGATERDHAASTLTTAEGEAPKLVWKRHQVEQPRHPSRCARGRSTPWTVHAEQPEVSVPGVIRACTATGSSPSSWSMGSRSRSASRWRVAVPAGAGGGGPRRG